MMDLRNATMKEGKRSGLELLPEESPVGESQSNGVIERGAKEVEYQMRSMISALGTRLGTDINASSNTPPWFIEYASALRIESLHSGQGL